MVEKKKILIVSHAMELGGAERSLLGILENIDTEAYDVDLFLLRHEGELLKYIPSNIHLLDEIPAYTVLARPMVQTLREGHVFLTGARLFGKIKASTYNKRHKFTDSGVGLEYSHKCTKRFMPSIQSNVIYDLAISFLTPHYFVAEKVKAKKKLAWIHTDYSKVQINAKSELKMWDQFDHIISISDSVTESFIRVFPTLESKVDVIENILPEKLIHEQSKEEINAQELESDDGIRLLSIGRYCTAKNFDNIPEICSILIRNGQNIKWFIIGFGSDEELIRKKIKEFHMEDHVILLGKKTNPYPYINACDIYVQPSRYEGKCVAVREAQILQKPVVITNYETSSSQLIDGYDGIIVPMDNKQCAEGISKVINDSQLQKSLKNNCSKNDYTNTEEINKIYELMKGE